MVRRVRVPHCRPGGAAKTVRTLSDARGYILKLPPAEQQSKEWQAATEAFLHAANGEVGPWLDFASIGIKQALHRHVEKIYDTSRKDPV